MRHRVAGKYGENLNHHHLALATRQTCVKIICRQDNGIYIFSWQQNQNLFHCHYNWSKEIWKTWNYHLLPLLRHKVVLEACATKFEGVARTARKRGRIARTLLERFFFAQNCSSIQTERRMGLDKVVHTVDRGLQIAQLVLSCSVTHKKKLPANILFWLQDFRFWH